MCSKENRTVFRKKLLGISIAIMTSSSVVCASQLPVKAGLSITLGIGGFGTPPALGTGSNFGMESGASGSPILYTAIGGNEGVKFGQEQFSEAENVDGDLGNNSVVSSVDNPWAFFGAEGVHGSTAGGITILDNAAASSATLDFSTWYVSWNNSAFIGMGGDPANFPADTQIATVTCDSDCSVGTGYTIDYAAHVPLVSADFPGTAYVLHLEGIVSDLNVNPVVSDGVLNVELSGTNTIDVSTLFSDVTDPAPDAIDCTAMVLTSANGAATQVGTSCVISYTDAGGIDAIDSFSFTVGDTSGGTSNSATVNVTINNAPVASNGNLVVDLSSGNSIDLKALVTDSSTIAWATLDYSTYAGTAIITDNGNGVVTYTDNGGAAVTNDPFDYTVDDTDGATSNVGTINVKVNNPPIASGTSTSVAPLATIPIDLSGLITDTDGTIDCTSFATTYAGTATIDFSANDCTGTYKDNGGIATTDSFNYTFNDNDGTTSNSATVNVNIVSGNLPPNANGATVTAQKDGTAVVDITTLASDSDGDQLDLNTITTSNEINGTVTIVNTATGVVTFTPDAGFTGIASFDYTIADNNVNPATSTPAATITVNVNAPPVSSAGSIVVLLSSSATIDLKTLVTDADGSGFNWATLDYSSYPGNATITDNGNGVVTYADNDGVIATDSFDYIVTDNDGGTSNSSTVSVIINAAPVATGSSVKVTPAATINITLDVVAASGRTVDCSTLAITYAGSAAVSDQTDCTVDYTDIGGIDTVDSFSFTVKDDVGSVSNSVTVTVTVNALPVASDFAVEINRNLSLVVDVVANTTDADGLDVTTVTASQGLNGATSVDLVTGDVTYTPNTGYAGADSFTYTIDDTKGFTSNTATVTVTVNNNLPIAAADNASIDVSMASSIALDVTANDTDSDGDIDRTTVTIVTGPSNGTASPPDALTGVVIYTPTTGYLGNDSFTYTIKDNDGSTSMAGIATFTMFDSTVTGAMPEDALLSFTKAVILKDVNDSPIPPVDGEGSWFGMEVSAGVITYTAIGSENSNSVQVGTSQLASGSHGGVIDGTERNNIDDPWEFFGSTGMDQSLSPVKILSDDGVGNVTLDLSGWSVTWNSIPSINMGGGSQDCGTAFDGICVTNSGADVPGQFENGTGIATVTCAAGSDGVSDCSVGDSYILDYNAIVPQADPSNFGGVPYSLHLEGVIGQGSIAQTAPVANDEAVAVASSGTIDIDLTDNVFDPFGNLATDIDFTNLTIGYGGAVGDPTVTDNGNGTVTFDDILGVNATYSFTYSVLNNAGESSNQATVIITVSSGNLPPAASSFSVQVGADVATGIDVTSAVTDDGTVDFTTVSASQSTNGNGTTMVDPVSGIVTYTPNTGFRGSDSFSYTVKDDAGISSNLAYVTVYVNDLPVAVDDVATVDRNASVDIDVSLNDTDTDGTVNPASVVIDTNPSNGAVVLDAATGVVTYSPGAGYLGTDSFTYTVNDDAGGTSNVATVGITVSNALPIAVDDVANIDVVFALSIDVDLTANDTDADGIINKTTVAIVTAATNGVTVIDPVTGVITYTPNAGFVGAETFTYTVNDDDGDTSNEATVVVNVSNSLGAVLPTNAFLTIVPASITSETIFITPADGEGSWFTMEVKPSELTHTSINGFNQLQLGTAQPATDNAPDIDQAWTFFGNLGVHQTTSVVTILSDNGLGSVTLDLSGWDVSWNKITSIPLGARANTPGFVDGVGIMTCAVDCSVGDTYILEYSSTVPDGDASGFGNVKYFLHLEGTITLVAPLIGGGDENAPSDVDESDATNEDGSVVTVASGDTANSVGNTSGIHLTPADIGLKDPLLNNKDGEQCIGGCVDFVATGITGVYADFVFKLNDVIPEGAAYRKLKDGVWQSFDESQGDLIGSAAAINGMCQGPGGVFEVGLRAGNMCLYIRIFDNGPNDADIIVGTITDPSGILLSGSPNTPEGSTSGCSISAAQVDLRDRADWLILAGFMVMFAIYRRRRSQV